MTSSSGRSTCRLVALAEPLARDASAYALLRRPGVDYAHVAALERVGRSPELDALPAELVEQWTGSLGIEAHYAGYVERQSAEIERQKREASTLLAGRARLPRRERLIERAAREARADSA